MKEVRLRALLSEPTAFGSSLARETHFTEADWRNRIKLGFSVLALTGEEPIGVASGIVERKSGDYELAAMWVDPEHRSSGVATLLVDAVTVWARSATASALVLWVVVGNTRARRFYERVGFRATGDRANLPSHPDLCAQKMTMLLR